MDQKSTRDFLGSLLMRMQKDMRSPEYKKKPELFQSKLRHYADMYDVALGMQKKPSKLKKSVKKKKKDAADEAVDTVASASPTAE